ncbi:MAG: hypothetical protein ACI8YQ_002669 [Polaribacter sp.]|jgi:hypothetical protein
MSKKIDFEIKESVLELKSLRKRVKSIRLSRRILFLILKDDPKYNTWEKLAEYLNVSEATLRFWYNAGFHSMKNYEIPENIKLVRIPPYSLELNASEKI